MLRRSLSEPVPLVMSPDFAGRLATWRLASMTATQPTASWTAITPATQAGWTRRRRRAGWPDPPAAAQPVAAHPLTGGPAHVQPGAGLPRLTAGSRSRDLDLLASLTRPAPAVVGAPTPLPYSPAAAPNGYRMCLGSALPGL